MITQREVQLSNGTRKLVTVDDTIAPVSISSALHRRASSRLAPGPLLTDYDPENPAHTRQVPVTCRRCGASYQLDSFFAEMFGGGICDACGRAVKEEEERAMRATSQSPEDRFMRIAPKAFFTGATKTNPQRRGFPRASLERALRWNPTGMDLLICGPSGAGKSRILWELLRLLMVEDQLDVEILQGGDFRQRMIEAYRASRSELVIDRLSRAPVLAWDDFGQDSLGPGMETDLRSVIDYRYRECMPTLITTQFDPDTLAIRLAGADVARRDVCSSIVRRIIERCEIVEIGGKR